MYELLDLLGRLPKPVKTLGIVFLLMPLCLVIARAMGFGQYWWAVVGGLIVIALLVAAFDAFVKKGDKARGGAFEKDLARDAQGGAGASKQEVREAVRELSQKWTESLAQLKGTGLQIYSLPWYLLIGEPQSGKSTTLKNSGLEFPVGGDGLSGSGGTRNCDWWFANEAVILDTAGRFTFQEEAAPDATEWSTFLRMLKKYRRDCPINGVLVVIPATSLLEDTPEEQDKKAANIRSKLMNLQRVLEIRFPVFIMVTKADRILGFSEFFSKLDPVDQRQLVGWSNPQGPDKQYALASFDEAYEEILTRIHKLRMKFTANEEIVQNVDRIFVFPEELRALGGSLKRYFQGIFQETRYDDPFVFRGFYLSSGVQQGKPIARATREMLGAAEGIVENLEQIFKRSRAFFIKDFYEKKVFPEQGLIARTKAAIQKEKTTVWVIRGLSAFIVLLVLGGMIPAFIGLKRIVEPIKRNVAAAQECVEKEPCPIPKAYGISRDLFKSQAEIRRHPFIFAMFFRGAASGELSDLLAKINQKLFLARVANPLMKEGEARMAQLDWAVLYDYRTFFGALDSHLKWWTVKKAVPGADQKPVVASTELKIVPLIQFCQNTKGMPATARSKEVDDWVASIATDGTPDQILATFLKEPPKDPEAMLVPDPGSAIRKFEEFWTVANLARWDFRLNQLLALYVQKYSELIKIEDPSSKGYLDRAAATGKDFKKVYDDTTKHLGTTKPGSKEFPGFGPDDWRRNFDADYDKLMRYTVVVPGVINENARNRIKGQIDSDWKNLEAQNLAYAYLVVADPQNPAKKAWSPSAAAISPMLVDVTAFADLAAFEAAENPKAVVEEASRKSTPADQKATLEAFSKKQVDAKAKATANVTAIAGIPPDQKSSWQDTALSAFVPRTADLALVFRVLPYTQQFLDKAIGPTCLENVCFTRNHAQQMVPLGVSYISFAEASSIATRPDVDALAQAHAETMLDYLRRYVDRFAGRRTGGGGGGFVVPSAALQARTWREFQAAITRWSPESQGGGDAPVTDMSGALTFDDVQTFAAANRRLNAILAYYKGKAAPVRASGGAAKAPPELVTAAGLFKNNVVPLPEQELKAWKQLSLAQEGVSLRGYHAFSRNPAVRRSTYGKQLIAVENRGANLIRDAIQPAFQQAAEPVVRKIREQCLGQFPFVRESQLRQERVAYASGSSLKPGGSGNSVTYRLDLASINQGHFSGVLTDVGSLADEYALNPILWGWEPQFDFVGDASRGLLAVGRGWQIFLFGGNRGTSVIKEHKVEIRPLQFTPSPGKRFMGDRVNSLFLFDRSVVVRPSTDFKTGKQPNPYVWRLGPSDAPMSITGRDEESKAGWTGSLEAYGGPLRFFYFVRIASEERDRRDDTDDPEKEREKERIWTIRVVIPNAMQRTEPLEGLFELAFDEPMPPILPN